MTYDFLAAAKAVKEDLYLLHRIPFAETAKIALHKIIGNLGKAIDTEIARLNSEASALAHIVGQATAIDARLNDEMNGGANPQSPTGDDYNDLYEIVMRYGAATKDAGEIVGNLIAATDAALNELHDLERACDSSGVIYNHLKPLADAFIAAGGKLDWYPPPPLQLSDVRNAIDGLVGVILRMDVVPPNGRKAFEKAMMVNNRLRQLDGSIAL